MTLPYSRDSFSVVPDEVIDPSDFEVEITDYRSVWVSGPHDVGTTDTLTLQQINDAIFPPVEVLVPTGTADDIRERIESEIGEEGRRRVTITESDMVSPGIAYIYAGRVYR